MDTQAGIVPARTFLRVERKREKTKVLVTSIIGLRDARAMCRLSTPHTHTHTYTACFISDGIYEKPRLVVAAEDRNLVRGVRCSPTRRMS